MARKNLLHIVLFLILVSAIFSISVSAQSLIDDPCRSCWEDGSCSQDECESITTDTGNCQMCDLNNCKSSCQDSGMVQGSYCVSDSDCATELHCSGVSTGVRIGTHKSKACCPLNLEWNSETQTCTPEGVTQPSFGGMSIGSPAHVTIGDYSSIIGAPQSTPHEVCNGKDDDFDGVIDDGVCGPTDLACKDVCTPTQSCHTEYKAITYCEQCGDGVFNICDFNECVQLPGCKFVYSFAKSAAGSLGFKSYGSCAGETTKTVCEDSFDCSKTSNPFCKSKANPKVDSDRSGFDAKHHGGFCNYFSLKRIFGSAYDFFISENMVCTSAGIWCYTDEIVKDGKCIAAKHGAPCNIIIKKTAGDLVCTDANGWFDSYSNIWCYEWEENKEGYCVGRALERNQKGCEYDADCVTNYCYNPDEDPVLYDYIGFNHLTRWSDNVCCNEGEYFDYFSQECSECGVPVNRGSEAYCTMKTERGCSCGFNEGKCSQNDAAQCAPGLVCSKGIVDFSQPLSIFSYAIPEYYSGFDQSKVFSNAIPVYDSFCCKEGFNINRYGCNKKVFDSCSDCEASGFCDEITCNSVATNCDFIDGACVERDVLHHSEGDCNFIECCDKNKGCTRDEITYCSKESKVAVCCYDWEVQDQSKGGCVIEHPNYDSDSDGYTDEVESLMFSNPEWSYDTPKTRAFTQGCDSFFTIPKHFDLQAYLRESLVFSPTTFLPKCNIFDISQCRWVFEAYWRAVSDVLGQDAVGVIDIGKLLFNSVFTDDTRTSVSRISERKLLDGTANFVKNFDSISSAFKNSVLKKVVLDIDRIEPDLTECEKITATKIYTRNYIKFFSFFSVASAAVPVTEVLDTFSVANKLRKVFKAADLISDTSEAFKGLRLFEKIRGIKYAEEILKGLDKFDLERLGKNLFKMEKQLIKESDDAVLAERTVRRFASNSLGRRILRNDLLSGGSGFSTRSKSGIALAIKEMGSYKVKTIFEGLSDLELKQIGIIFNEHTEKSIVSLLKNVEHARDLIPNSGLIIDAKLITETLEASEIGGKAKSAGVSDDMLMALANAVRKNPEDVEAFMAKYEEPDLKIIDRGISEYQNELNTFEKFKNMNAAQKQELLANLFRKADWTGAPAEDASDRMRFFMEHVNVETLLYRGKRQSLFDSMNDELISKCEPWKDKLVSENFVSNGGKMMVNGEFVSFEGSQISFFESRLKNLFKIEEKIYRDALAHYKEKVGKYYVPSTEELMDFRANILSDAASAEFRLNDVSAARINVMTLAEQADLVEHLRKIFGNNNVKDYVNEVKLSGYRAIHLIVTSEDGYSSEIQIRTLMQTLWDKWHHDKIYKGIYSTNNDVQDYAKKVSDVLFKFDEGKFKSSKNAIQFGDDELKKLNSALNEIPRPEDFNSGDDFVLPEVLRGKIE